MLDYVKGIGDTEVNSILSLCSQGAVERKYKGGTSDWAQSSQQFAGFSKDKLRVWEWLTEGKGHT